MPIKQISPEEASKLVADGHKYIDVRTEAEFDRGHPTGAVNIPVVFPDPATRQMKVNPAFLATVQAHFKTEEDLVIGCQSGVRSQRAAEMLAQAGYSSICNMQGGFGGARDSNGRVVVQGWADSGLPVESGSPADRSYEAMLKKSSW
jgi:rhodanese-related sulfurtransferase